MAGLSQTYRAILVKRFSAGEATPGAQLQADFGNIPTRDAQGRYGHLVGFALKMAPTIQTTAAAMTAPCEGRRLVGIIREIQMEALGVPLFGPGIDGRDLRFDVQRRLGRVVSVDPIDLEDADNANAAPPQTFVYLFGGSRKPGREMDGAIPLPILNHRDDPNASLRFHLHPGTGGALPPGVEFKGFPSLGLQAWALVRYEDEPWVGPWTHLRQTETPETQGAVVSVDGLRLGRADYVAVRHKEEDAAGQPLTDYGPVHVQVAGNAHYAATPLADAVALQEVTHGRSHLVDDDVLPGNYFDLAGGAAEADAGDLPELPLTYQFDSRTRPKTRLVIRERIAQTAAERQTIAARWGLPDAGREVGGRFVGRLSLDLTPQRIVIGG